MRAFSAVSTTGIYCRPECPGRPLPEHVTKYELPAAAEAAGYRACLRCRPYRNPKPLSWTGPELVCRAVRLILDGALDGRTEAALGARLGVSPRHLRRLFTAHLGVTPDALARSARVHFARRLLDDTDLPVFDVAGAAGFGSVRQLNRACHDVFRMSPRELRARRRVTDPIAGGSGLVLRLPFDGPLDWDGMLRFFAPRAIPGVEAVADGAYRRTIVVGGEPGALELTRGGADHLLLRLHLPEWDELIHIVERARRITGVDLELDGPARDLAGDPLIGPLVDAQPGLRVPGTWDPFETGVRAIAGQQVSVAAATTVTGRIAARFGTPVAGGEAFGLDRTFPDAETLAGADLSGLGFTSGRAEAIRGFARAVAADEIRLDRSVSLDRFVASMVAVRGLGKWTAHYLALRMGEPDAFPDTDLGLVRSHARRSDTPLPRAAEAWRPWRALAAAHLWAAA